MNTCVHTWLYIGSKRQNIWRCTLCDEYRIDDPTQKREWVGLTDDEMHQAAQAMDAEPLAEGWKEPLRFARAIEAKLREKNT
jgi:hypothetical protein